MKERLPCILLVDDDEPTNFLYRIIINQAGCADHVRIVQSGTDALDYLSQAETGSAENPQPALIFLDINMPRADGWEFIEKYAMMLENPSKKAVIIMLSTSLNPDDEFKAKNNPYIAGFRQKPLTHEMLQEILEYFFP